MFTSNAKWPKEVSVSGDGRNVSTDQHHTKKGAQAVCDALERNGFGGEGKIFPIETWVEQVGGSASSDADIIAACGI